MAGGGSVVATVGGGVLLTCTSGQERTVRRPQPRPRYDPDALGGDSQQAAFSVRLRAPGGFGVPPVCHRVSMAVSLAHVTRLPKPVPLNHAAPEGPYGFASLRDG
jgi:hypothetical protein